MYYNPTTKSTCYLMSLFIRSNTNGDHHWYEFCCPQCCSSNPPLAAAQTISGDPPPIFKRKPKWVVKESDQGLQIGALNDDGGGSYCRMIKEHQLFDAPACLLRPELEGLSMGQYSRKLAEAGQKRSKAFGVMLREAEAKREEMRKPGERRNDWIERTSLWFDEQLEAARQVTPKVDGPKHDGPDLEKRAEVLPTTRVYY